MAKILKELKGHSGSEVTLMENDSGLWVRKFKNVDRNYERLSALYKSGYPVPEIYTYLNQTLEMEYIHGLDMKNYLLHNTSTKLQEFLLVTLDCFSENSIIKDYTKTYYQKLAWLDSHEGLPFTKEQLIERLPKNIPQSMYHGDLTLENIIYTDPGFHMIDAVTVEYDSWVFDVAKLRQDLECKWFLRHSDAKLDFKLQNIQDTLRECYPEAFNDNVLILMLLRVYLHTKEGDFEREFILREINRLWK
jgi:tRNA A-37 threonylcarbamoyl transferase component Bud32